MPAGTGSFFAKGEEKPSLSIAVARRSKRGAIRGWENTVVPAAGSASGGSSLGAPGGDGPGEAVSGAGSGQAIVQFRAP